VAAVSWITGKRRNENACEVAGAESCLTAKKGRPLRMDGKGGTDWGGGTLKLLS